MKVNHVPSLGAKYWAALIIASIFGANTGDFLADQLGLGHLAGLPVLAVLFAVVLLAERRENIRHYTYFWLGIIIIRTSATNLGDFSHDLGLSPLGVMGGLAVLLSAAGLYWHDAYLSSTPWQPGPALATRPLYWFIMLIAGTLGTVIGDYFSFGLGLGTLRAALVLASVLAVAGLLCRNGLTRAHAFTSCYWLVVVLIRSAGTAAGDYVAHRLGLPVSTLVTGLCLAALLVFWKEPPFSRKLRLVPCAQ